MHLSDSAAVLAIGLVEQPSIMLELFDEMALSVAMLLFPDYDSIHGHIHVKGVVTRRMSGSPQLQLMRFACVKCGFTRRVQLLVRQHIVAETCVSIRSFVPGSRQASNFFADGCLLDCLL